MTMFVHDPLLLAFDPDTAMMGGMNVAPAYALMVVDREVAFTTYNEPQLATPWEPAVVARASGRPLYVRNPGTGEFEEDQGFFRTATIDVGTGYWLYLLPWPSQCRRPVTFAFERLNGAFISGTVPEGEQGPATCDDLLQLYGWQEFAARA